VTRSARPGRAAELLDEARRSLLWVPLAVVVTATLVSVGLRLVPEELARRVVLLDVPPDVADRVLQVSATAAITVASLTFSITVIAVQLASSQFSPRALRGFLRDRVSQVAIGAVGGTFLFSLIMLVWRPGSDAQAALAANAALLGDAAVLVMLLVYIDHMARRLQAGDLMREVTSETITVLERLFVDDAGAATLPEAEPDGVIRSPEDGWVQRIDLRRLLAAVPAATTVVVEIEVGKYAMRDGPLVTVWGDVERIDPGEVADAFAIGDQRRLRSDPALGARQLIDIALRALSPGVNDPATAYEAANNVASVLCVALQRDGVRRREEGDEDRVVLRPYAVHGEDIVDETLREIRIAAAPHPTVVEALLHAIVRVDEACTSAGRSRTDLLRAHAASVYAEARGAGLREEDLDRVRTAGGALLDREP
jgi:uncharacterized membrane protein